MIIKDGFTIDDKVSGLRLTFIKGTTLNHVKIENISKPICNNRYFYFDKKGEFDGTGSDVE